MYTQLARPSRLLPAVALTLLLLAACGGAEQQGAAVVPGARSVGASSDPEEYREQLLEASNGNPRAQAASLSGQMTPAEAVRFLNQATFGAVDADRDKAKSLGRLDWIRDQYGIPAGRGHLANYERIDRERLRANPNGVVDQEEQATHAIWHSYVTAPDQLRKRIGYALSQIFVVSLEERGLVSPGLAFLDKLESNAFGNFRTLLEDVSLSSAMGMYLTYNRNRQAEYPDNNPNLPPIRVPDENYAREIMQLFTIGLVELNLDGSPRLVDGRRVNTYSQNDVEGLARVFTGFAIGQGLTRTQETENPMFLGARHHSLEEKSFLGTTIPPGTGGLESLRIALDVLFNHPNTAPFIGKQLIQRLVTSNPSPDYVRRVALAFQDNGLGVRGDMRAVIEAVLLDEEATDRRNLRRASATFGKLREPVIRFTNLARAFGAETTPEFSNVRILSSSANGLAQSPLNAPSVFNFYRPGYVPPSTDLSDLDLVAPEFQITTDNSVASYINFVNRYLLQPEGGLRLDLTSEVALSGSPDALVARLNRRLTNNAMSSATRDLIIRTVTALPNDTDVEKLNRVRTAILMTAVSPEFVTQK